MNDDVLVASFLTETNEICNKIDRKSILKGIEELKAVRTRGGRLFILGVGGSAGNASHAVNDFRKLGGIESYAPSDNVSELTARINDESWEVCYSNWLKGSKISSKDLVMVFSVGGGSVEKNTSVNLVRAVQYAKQVGASVCGIVGRDGGFTATVADAVVLVPTVNADHITPHAEAFQAVVWHLLVSHPSLKAQQTHWESKAK